MSDDLSDRLHDAQVCRPAQNYCRNRHVMEDAANRIEMLEHRLNSLVQACEYLRDGSGFNKTRHEHTVSSSTWSAFCAAMKHAKHGI